MAIHALASRLFRTALAASVLLLARASLAQTVNLTAGPATATLPDGSTVPMWGYSCGTLDPVAPTSCASLDPLATTSAVWSPVVITVPYVSTGTNLTINLTNSLPLPPGATAGIPTSLMIWGQLGGGLGDPTQATSTASPSHASQIVTWATVGSAPAFTPPPQGSRVQSFGTEVARGATTSLTWKNLRPGTYLIESGTHPSIQGPMGLYGMLVVTQAPTASAAGNAYGTALTATAVSYNAEVPVLLSEIDPIQNNAVAAAVSTAGFVETSTYNLRNQVASVTASGGTLYAVGDLLTFTGGGGTGAAAHVSAVGTGGVITAIMVDASGSGYTGVPIASVTSAAGTGAALTVGMALSPNTLGTCGGGAAACYPPAVNYTPLYYAINGVAFDKTHPANSLFPALTGAAATPVSGTMLVRIVNAGLRMHVPSIVGSTAPLGSCVPGTSCPGGFALIAEDGNPATGVPAAPRVQSEVFMSAGKTFDVMVNVPATPAPLPIYDRELSLSGNAVNRDAGMLAYLGVNGATVIQPAANVAVTAVDDTYNVLVAYGSPTQTQPFTVSDPSKGVIANDVNVFGVTLITTTTNGVVTLNRNGTFTYTPNAGSTATTDSFTYCANGTVTGTACSTGKTAKVTLGPATLEAPSAISCTAPSFTSNTAVYLTVKPPGILGGCTDTLGFPVSVSGAAPSAPLSFALTGPGTGTALVDANGGFTATVTLAGIYSFSFQPQSSQGVQGAAVLATINFLSPSGLKVSVLDGTDKVTPITDYRWVIEEDRTFYINPKCVQNPPPAGCPTSGAGIVPTFGVNFHTSYMPFVAQGCTGPKSCEFGQTVLGTPAVCDLGNGACRLDTGNGTTSGGSAWVDPSQVHLDPTKRYYLSVMPGDAADPFIGAYGGVPCGTPGAPANCVTGHGMGGAPVGIDPNTGLQQASVTVYSQPSPYPPSQLSVFVFEDDFPLNGEHDAGGGVDVVAPLEPGLGGFEVILWDAMGKDGDFTGQLTHDMFNQPLSNSLDGTIDPLTGQNACPISQQTVNTQPAPGVPSPQAGITGRIVTCPKYEADNKTLSPLAGQAVISNLMPGRFGIIATPAADRIARGEEWLQTNTLDGQKAHDSFARIGEPAYFQEFGPASYHVTIGFANPAIINGRLKSVCNGTNASLTATNCTNTLTGMVTSQRLSRTPDERLYSSGSHDAYYWTQCFVSVGDPDGMDFAFAKCAADGTFKLTGLPDGDWRVTTFDQWNDQLVDGLSSPVRLGGVHCTSLNPNLPIGCNPAPTPNAVNMEIAATQWQTNLYTKTFIDDNRDGIAQSTETGIPFANVAVRLRDGALANLLLADFTGTANFNETFPLFSWYVVETDVTRYKNTGTHVVYDVGGPADGSASCGAPGYPPCGYSLLDPTLAPSISKFLANTAEIVSVPTELRVPGAIYCADADCTGKSMNPAATGPATNNTSAPPSSCTTAPATTTTPYPVTTCSPQLSSGRIDPPWVGMEGWQGFPGQANFIEFGKAPYYQGENGGIHGHVIYASTRPFDDPYMLVQTQWEPLVPHVTINLYQEGFAADGVTPTLTLVDTTQTSSFDDWAQGFHTAIVSGVATRVPNMNCPGQGAPAGTGAAPATNAPIPDLFFFSLFNQPNYLDLYGSQHGGPASTPLPYNSQFKCYDGMHNWNQLQPAPYDGAYQFPSVTSVDANGRPNGTNCSICGQTPDPSPTTGPDADPLRAGLPMLPPGKYVVEIVVPPGMELVKEEDKNILIGDNFIAPAVQQFGGLGNIFILPDQASVAGTFSAGAGYNAYNAQNPTQNFGAAPNNGIVPAFVPEPTWPCVGELRTVPDYISLFPQSHQVSPFAGAVRHLCDRKEVTLSDQMGAIAKFFVYTSTHIASKFTGGITDDYTSEFDPFSPQFGEKFAPPDLPVSIKDWTGTETSRVYADHWGAYNGMTYSTWEVNPPNPTGYSPTMMVMCMNDPGPVMDTSTTSPTYNSLITDPLFTEGYSQFCYELPFMPGTTTYLDTPVVPTSAFAGAGYNNVDCAEPDSTPAISEVDGDSFGPWVATSGARITITALGDQMVPNYAYSGPSATSAPFNQKTVKRHYGFGSRCNGVGGACVAASSVTIGGIAAPINSWSDTSITVTVPPGVANCAVQQQALYGGSTAQCGELVITAGNGKKSIDAVTVTIGGKAPTHVAATGSIQTAIDGAQPGDLLIIDPAGPASGGKAASPAVHNELVVMWKPLRLQGVGASSSVINANTHPAGKLTPWRARMGCLFGLGPDGTPGSFNASCGAGWTDFSPTTNNPQVDRFAFEAIVGWDASGNGNIAQLLQEPTLMGALEGAGITVVAKGVFFPSNPFDPTLVFGFPTGTVLFTSGNTGTYCDGTYPSNFQCNPSSIDAIGITDSSQGGGGVLVHAWGHNIQIANNRIHNNSGTLSGGINVGLGEFPPSTVLGAAANVPPGSCETGAGLPNGTQLPYCLNTQVNVHHNWVSLNSSTGDELFSATPAGAGGVSFCTGSDYYKFNNNWLCGNLSNGDGGGLAHLGFSKNGDIEHNTILFNQSTNPTIPTNGGGMVIMGTPDVDPACGANTDQDCVSPLGAIGPSDGIGPGLVINANLVLGNAAESGSGGGIAFQNLNGSDVLAFPLDPTQWYGVTLTNNIIANNVAGWDGAGLSLLDAFKVGIVNNTIISNVTTASAGVLNNTLGAPLASTQNCPPGGTNSQGFCTVAVTSSTPQAAGLVTINNSAILSANLATTINCPAAFNAPGGTVVGGNVANGTCRTWSYPLLQNNVVYGNETTYIATGSLSPAFQQNIVSLYNSFTNTPVGTVPFVAATTANGTGGIVTGGTGACLSSNQYWDIGARGDTSPTAHSSGVTLNPVWSVLSPNATGYNANNVLGDPQVQSLYCDGSRQPPEACATGAGGGSNTGCGWAVPPGIADATVPNPIFNLTPVATVDEGNNWINIRWGPLSLTNPTTVGPDGNYGAGDPLGNYALASSSPAVDHIPVCTGGATPPACINTGTFPATDFFGNPRPDAARVIDVGAVEHQNGGGSGRPVLTSVAPTSGLRGTNVNVALFGSNLTGVTTVNPPTGITVVPGSVVVVSDGEVTATLTIAPLAALGPHNITVNVGAVTSNPVVFTTVAPAAPTLTSISPTSGVRGTQVPVTLTGTNLTGTISVNAPGSPNITVVPGSVVVVNATTVTATLNLARATALGGHNITVTTPGGNSNAVVFTVLGATLTFSAPSPALTTGTANTSIKSGMVTVTNTATGANAGSFTFTAAPTVVKVTGPTVSSFSVISGGTCAAVTTVLAPGGGSCTINVQYNPGGSTTTSTAHVTVAGTGIAPLTQSGANFSAN